MTLSIFVSGCGFSMRETYIRGQRPATLKNYKNGLIARLSPEQIQEAIDFGKKNRLKPDVINYAFIYSKNITNFLGGIRQVYILICSNYYLIADYAAKQTKNYEAIDMDYVNFLATLPTFHIETVEQVNPVGAGLYAFQSKVNFVLLKDGIKVQEAESNPLYNDKSPYSYSHLLGVQNNWQETANAVVKQTMEMANKIAEQYRKDLKIDSSDVVGLSVQKPSHLYNYSDINLSSKYEIVVIYENEEKRIPIDFSRIK
ncbi:MAG: hypothetical protein KJ931_01120 [Candidatus Omnitrophica bacterium]|nr:hypothetical protein [Candidatus Omnitrophota bacterium]